MCIPVTFVIESLMPKDISGLGAERHTNSDVTGAAGDVVGHQAVEANGRQQHRQQAKGPGEPRNEAVGIERMRDEFRHRFYSDRKESRIGLLDGLANRLADTCGIPENAHFIGNGRMFPERTEIGEEDAWPIVLTQPVEFRIRDDARAKQICCLTTERRAARSWDTRIRNRTFRADQR